MKEKDDLLLKWFSNNYDNNTLGYFYSLEDFRKEKQWYENKMNVKLKVYWLWKK